MTTTRNGHLAQTYLWELFKDFYREHPNLVLTNLAFLFLYPVQDIVLPHFYGRIMDKLSQGEVSKVRSEVVVVVTLLILSQMLFMASDYHNAKLIPMMESYVRGRLIENILDRHEMQHEDLQVGEIITKVIKIPSIIVLWFDRFKSYVMPYMLVYVLASVYFLMVDIQLTLGFVIIIILLVSTILKSPFDCSQVSSSKDKAFNEIHRQIDDILSNLFSVYGSGQKKQELQRLQSFAQKYAVQYEATTKCALRHMFVMNPCLSAFIVFFVWRCGQLISSNRMKTSTFITVFIIFLYILNSIIILNDQIREIIFEWGMIEASADMLFAPATLTLSTTPKTTVIPHTSGIGLWHVSFAYPGSNKQILKDVTLHIAHGEKVCFVGDIGSGKSTIIKLLLKYHLPTNGQLYIDGVTYNDIPVSTLRKRIGYVPQQPILFNRTLMENILYGNDSYTTTDVVVWLHMFGLYDEFHRIGFDTIIGKNGSKLSGGQRQLVWCLRIMLYNPEILILDEPTASIDEKAKHVLQYMLDTIMQGKTVIMVTHDPFLEKYATRLIRLENNGIIS